MNMDAAAPMSGNPDHDYAVQMAAHHWVSKGHSDCYLLPLVQRLYAVADWGASSEVRPGMHLDVYTDLWRLQSQERENVPFLHNVSKCSAFQAMRWLLM